LDGLKEDIYIYIYIYIYVGRYIHIVIWRSDGVGRSREEWA